MARTMIVPGRGRVKVNEGSPFGCGEVFFSGGNESSHRQHETPYERTKRQVYATGNKWAIENFHATHD